MEGIHRKWDQEFCKRAEPEGLGDGVLQKLKQNVKLV